MKTSTHSAKCSRCPSAAFNDQPLTKALMVEGGRPRVRLTVRKVPPLPELKWTLPARPASDKIQQVIPVGQTSAPRESHVSRANQATLSRVRQAGKVQSASPSKGTASKERTEAEAGQVDLNEALLRQAIDCEKAGDHLSAAMYYGLLNDVASRARCFQKAATARDGEPLARGPRSRELPPMSSCLQSRNGL